MKGYESIKRKCAALARMGVPYRKRPTRRQAERAEYDATLMEAERRRYDCGPTSIAERASGPGSVAITLSDVPWVAHAHRDGPAPASWTGV